MKNLVSILSLLFVFSSLFSLANAEPQPAFAELYYEGEVVKTIVPPAAMKKPGTENLYGVPGQRPVVATAPGDKNYRGGKWAFHAVTWSEGVTPYLLTSETAIHMAEIIGDIEVTRVYENDFKCPVML